MNRMRCILALVWLAVLLTLAGGATKRDAATHNSENGWAPLVPLAEIHREVALLESEEEDPSDPDAPAFSWKQTSPCVGRSAFRGLLQSAERSSDILLLIQRQNE